MHWAAVATVLQALTVGESVTDTEYEVGASERTHVVELKLGSFLPQIDAEFANLEAAKRPYASFFGGAPMLMFQLEAQRYLWKELGSIGAGLSLGYAEKYAHTFVTGTDRRTNESSSLRVVPLRALVSYRFDWAAQRYGVPLVPYLKLGLGGTLWSASNASGSATASEAASGAAEAKGIKWGYTGVLGAAFMLDVLEPRLAKDADSDLGINHFYFFGEYVYEDFTNFGRGGLNLSSRRWMFGLALEF